MANPSSVFIKPRNLSTTIDGKPNPIVDMWKQAYEYADTQIKPKIHLDAIDLIGVL